MMKKLLLIALAFTVGASFNQAEAQKRKVKKRTDTTIKLKEPVVLRTASDTLSYVAGMSLTNGLSAFLKQQHGVDSTNMNEFVKGFEAVIKADGDPKMKAYVAGMEIANQLTGRIVPGMKKEFTDTPDSLVNDILYRGFTDAVSGDEKVFTQKQADELFAKRQAANKAAKDERLYGANRAAGEKFLAENALKDSVKTTPSGLQYKVITMGNGPVPQASDKVQVHYEGRLVDGTVFDASKKHGDKPLSFRADQVIKGWTEALTMMPVGSKWQLYIPYQLAYGERNAGQIKPYSALIFDVELVGIEK
jgi:FKBP-type peptidyl-prolyl cis-trans isomerase FklB